MYVKSFVVTVQTKVLANVIYHILLVKYIHNQKKDYKWFTLKHKAESWFVVTRAKGIIKHWIKTKKYHKKIRKKFIENIKWKEGLSMLSKPLKKQLYQKKKGVW